MALRERGKVTEVASDSKQERKLMEGFCDPPGKILMTS